MRNSEGQSRRMSLVEVAVNTTIGYVVAVLSQYLIFPCFGVHVSLAESATMGVWFTAISIARSYVLRRVFNGLRRA